MTSAHYHLYNGFRENITLKLRIR